MASGAERRHGFGRRWNDAERRDPTAEQDAATAGARQAESAAVEERRLLGIERNEYRQARMVDERERWEAEKQRTSSARNSPSYRQDLYESDFTDLEQMRRDRPDE